ncbi:MAG: reprolysin-like metallopeptidase [Pseudomonadota bacterium]
MTRHLRSLWLGGLILAAVAGCGGGGGGGGNPTGVAPTGTASPTAPASAAPTSAPPATASDPTTTIKVLAVYGIGVTARYPEPELRFEHLLNVANDILATSGADLALELAAVEAVEYPAPGDLDQALDDVTFGRAPSLDQVWVRRNAAEADLVVLFVPYPNTGRCGVAWVGGSSTNGDLSGSARFGYSVVAPSCSDFVLAHEIGHNLGLVHSRREDPAGGSLPYGAGYGVDGEFVTVMASPDLFSAPRLARLSNPAQLCENVSCGIDAGDPDAGADAVRAISAVQADVAAWR